MTTSLFRRTLYNHILLPTTVRLSSWSIPQRRLSLIFLVFLLSALRLTAATSISETHKLEKLAPELVIVQVENGKGSTSLIFAIKDGSAVPAFRLTPAVGSSRTIPETDITFVWSATASPNTTTNRTLLTAQLTVNTSVFVEPGVDYKGRIIFVWPNSEQLIDFTVVDKSSLAFDLSESKLDLVLGPNQPTTVSLKLRNTGNTEIRKVVVSSSTLVDGETQHRTALPIPSTSSLSAPIRAKHESEVAIALPVPALAGSYAGTLDVVANDSLRKSIPIVLRSRGPVLAQRISFLPFVLFFLTLALGFFISTKLDEWFNLGGLRQSEALLSLQRSEQGLARLLDQLGRWENDLGAEVFGQTTIRLEQSLLELRGLLGAYSDIAYDHLIAEAQRYAFIWAQGNLLRGFGEVAIKRWEGDAQKAKLLQVLAALDAVPPDADLNAYRENLRNTLSASADDSGASLLAIDDALPRVPQPGDLRAKIKRMARLQRTVVLVVVFISAYQIFYAHHFDFGTLLDYLGVFLWTLGLTQTGSQILKAARSNYNPTP